jgi:hypothetical protein
MAKGQLALIAEFLCESGNGRLEEPLSVDALGQLLEILWVNDCPRLPRVVVDLRRIEMNDPGVCGVPDVFAVNLC